MNSNAGDQANSQQQKGFQKRIQLQSKRWFRILFNGPARSHALCAMIGAALCGLIGWLWICPETLTADRSHSMAQITDAVQLINNNDLLRERFQSANLHHKTIQSRIDEISDWLPRKRTFDSIRSDLQKITSESDVQMIAIDRGKMNIGTRVAVLNTRVELQGSYPDLCRFLTKLASLKTPIWCDEVRIVRVNQFDATSQQEVGEQPIRCFATLSLRAPFASEETTGGKLLARESSDAT